MSIRLNLTLLGKIRLRVFHEYMFLDIPEFFLDKLENFKSLAKDLLLDYKITAVQ